ncbi:hypothetical protein Rhsp01_18260 [Rhizobium sp. NBRC 114257]|uniref:Uncharacterized protein n=1 Tax=Rhizobium dioscoreae TaxID=2653122 RepID=A0ABQ0Z1C1_9HYPH|nr:MULTISPECIES: hypothetical protein [Rhizobium]GES49208.1 hypothetical protein RsS93_18220 [Rhizobium dioscoreae]GLU80650.1 hypothetical protein Rhsp01_18260 [Rhizobium sp. NBRC 114257]
MIWFDAALEKHADDDLLRRSIATVLSVDTDSVDVIHDIAQIADMPATCLVTSEAFDDYSQTISIYHSSDLHPPLLLDAASQLARLLQRSLLVANDETTNPYSFILISGAGEPSVVLVDPDALDENDRYVITSHTSGISGQSRESGK